MLSYHIYYYLSILVIVLLPVFALGQESIDDLKKEIDVRAKEIFELKAQEEKYKGAALHAEKNSATLEDLVIDYNRRIEKVESDVVKKKQEITTVTLDIKRTELEIEAKAETLKRVKAYVAATLVEVYRNDDERSVELFLAQENFSDFFNQVEYRRMLQEDLYFRLEDVKETKRVLEEEKASLASDRDDLKVLQGELEHKNQLLEGQRTEKQELLQETRNEEWRYKELVKTTKEKQEEIQREIFELEEKLRSALDAASIPTPRPGLLMWPAEGKLSQGYGCTQFAKNSKFYPTCFHNGMDVAASYGTPVVAARDGAVVALASAPYAYGKWIAVKHDNGLITLYAHLSLQLVNVGQEVKRGEVIGNMGSTGLSTGSHVHFTVYAPNTFSTKPSTISGTLPIGATLDPFDYLP